MQINGHDYINFGANFNSPVLRFRQADFFVPIRGYGKNKAWAKETKSIADTAVNLIRNDTTPENVFRYIAVKMRGAAEKTTDARKIESTGILRTNRKDWGRVVIDENAFLTTPYGGSNYSYGKSRYHSYKERFNNVYAHPLKNPYMTDNFELTMPFKPDNALYHGSHHCINNVLDFVFAQCDRIFPKFVHQDIKPENLKQVNDIVAEMRWVLAHSTPFKRGSDAISNVFMRAIYKAIGVKTYPLKKGVSLDLEAFCTELADYKRLFPNYFVKSPEIIQ